MRVPVYPRGANPRIDRPILRKSALYASEQVANLLADWVDPSDPAKGIVACEFLPSGKAVTCELSDLRDLAYIGQEIPGVKFVPPPEAKDVMGMVHDREARRNWDWKPEGDQVFKQMAEADRSLKEMVVPA